MRWPYRQNEKNKGTVEIEQLDGAVYVDHIACLVECKDQTGNDIAPIYKLRGQLLRRPATTIGAIFTSGEYTEVTRLLSGFMFPQTILLWTPEEIETCLEHGRFSDGLLLKYQKAISHGTTDYNVSQIWNDKEQRR
ncbi:MAG TPA: hypothetical protein PK156_43595 [Polyangium sp.]|nr:hypothetical protein [Polyangium sp.]